MQYNWIDNDAYVFSDYAIIHFYENFNQKMKPNTLPKNLTKK